MAHPFRHRRPEFKLVMQGRSRARHTSVRTDMEEDSSPGVWNCPVPDVMERIKRFLQKEHKWNHVGPRLRLLNSYWRNAVDSCGSLLCMKKLHDFPLCKDIESILERKTIVALHASPQHGRIFKLHKLGEMERLHALKEVKLKEIDNGDEVLSELAPLQSRLHTLDLDSTTVSETGLNSLAGFSSLTALKLRNVKGSADSEPVDYQWLRELKNLTELVLANCSSCDDVEFLNDLTNLESFTFARFNNSVTNLDCVCNLPRLVSLSFLSVIEVGFDFQPFALPKGITALTLSDVSRRMISFDRQEKVQKLAFQNVAFDTPFTKREQDLSWFNYFASNRSGSELIVARPLLQVAAETVISACSRTLTAVDLSRLVLKESDFMTLTLCSRLKELRMHRITIAVNRAYGLYSDGFGCLMFESLKVLTVGLLPENVKLLGGLFAPSLEHVGLWINEGELNCAAEIVRSMPNFKEVSFVITRKTFDQSFWISVRSALERHMPLKRIGWKSLRTEEFAEPEFLKKSFPDDILFDNDITVFDQWH